MISRMLTSGTMRKTCMCYGGAQASKACRFETSAPQLYSLDTYLGPVYVPYTLLKQQKAFQGQDHVLTPWHVSDLQSGNKKLG